MYECNVLWCSVETAFPNYPCINLWESIDSIFHIRDEIDEKKSHLLFGCRAVRVSIRKEGRKLRKKKLIY